MPRDWYSGRDAAKRVRVLKRMLAIRSGYGEARRKGLRYLRAPYAHNGAAAAHSLQFGTYALWTAGLLAALAVRPVPSCILSLARGVNDQALNDVCPGQTLTPS
jgi:hypothetical protein